MVHATRTLKTAVLTVALAVIPVSMDARAAASPWSAAGAPPGAGAPVGVSFNAAGRGLAVFLARGSGAAPGSVAAPVELGATPGAVAPLSPAGTQLLGFALYGRGGVAGAGVTRRRRAWAGFGRLGGRLSHLHLLPV